MKKIIKEISLSLALCLLPLSGICRSYAQENMEEKSVYEHGLELISLLEEMAGNESYLSMYSSNPEILEVLAGAGNGNYEEPENVYSIRLKEGVLAAVMEDERAEGLSDTLKKYVLSRAQTAVVSQLNAAGGDVVLAAAGICSAGKAFVCEELTEDVIYLYTYEDAVPVMVSFTVGEDGAVAASASFLFNEDMGQILEQGMDMSVEEMRIEIEKLDFQED